MSSEHGTAPSTFASRLSEAMATKGMSISKLAREVGITHSAISRLVNGQRGGSKFTAQIARALGVNPLWLAEGISEAYPVASADQLNRALMHRVIMHALPILRNQTLTASQTADMLIELYDHWAIIDAHGSNDRPPP